MQRIGKEIFELERGNHLIQFSVESRLSPDVITSYYDTQNQNMSPDDHVESLAQVAIKRITINGSDQGGAYTCKKCPAGTVSSEGAS